MSKTKNNKQKNGKQRKQENPPEQLDKKLGGPNRPAE